MKLLSKFLLAAVTFVIAAVSPVRGQTVVQFTSLMSSLGRETVDGHETDSYVAKFQIRAAVTGGDAIILVGEALIFGDLFATVYADGIARQVLDGAYFSMVSGATFGSNGPYYILRENQQAVFNVGLSFQGNSVLSSTDTYGVMFNTISYQWGDVNAFISTDGESIDWGNTGLTRNIVNLVGPEWTAGTVSPIPEPSTYAAIFGASALGLAFYRNHKRRKLVPVKA